MVVSIKSFRRLTSARRFRSLAVSLSAVLLATASIPSLASAHVSLAYQISGVELPSTSTTANFTGSAVGENNEQAAWSASVQHTILNPDAQITGGSFSFLIFHVPETVRGNVAGGTIQLTAQAPGCGQQTYAVTGTLAKVTSSTADPTLITPNGAFQATLTHFRTRLGRLCVTYFATIVGQVQLNLS